MDIFNKTPVISEDTLCYAIYPQPDLSDKTSVTTFAACIHAHVHSLLPGFIWHRDAFELKVVQNPDSEGWMLEGRMRVGDCVDDEWCTVWLLREISSKWDVAISVFDSDGEFLLIEAADALPTWVKPTNSENRVWIYNSHLHLIPISHISPPSRKRRRRNLPGAWESEEQNDGNIENDDDDFIAVEDALNLIRDSSVDTIAPSDVEKIVWQRIFQYPAAARSHVHTTKAYIPVDVARVLFVNPSLVQKPVETFYTRDANQLRAAHRMIRFPPQPSILRTVKLTRTAYAQLVGQKFYPPKAFGQFQEKGGTTEWRWRDVGMKIACGFEMLYQESKGRADGSSRTEVTSSSTEAKKDALRRNPDYVKYIQNLISVGYFRGETEGSRLWTSLEDQAATIFVEVRREDDATRQSFATLVAAALTQTAGAPLSPTQDDEDSDDWLNISSQDFDNRLEQTMWTSGSKDRSDMDSTDVDMRESENILEDRMAAEQASKLQNLASKVEEFVEGESHLEGAKFEDEPFSDDEFSDEVLTSDSDGDPEQETTAERQAAMENLVPGLAASEYGKMPASYHRNSQRVAPTTIATDVVEQSDGEKDSKSAEARVKPIRQPILLRDKFDGVDSDDETDEEDALDDEESEEERPQVVGDIEIDMGEEENEFLEFARQALGLTDEQWGEIIRDRKDRGAFVPSDVATKPSASSQRPGMAGKVSASTSSGQTETLRSPSNINPDLDSFEAVMQAMDAELARSRPVKVKPATQESEVPDKGKGKVVVTADDEDIEAAMDAELRATLERGDDMDDDLEGEEPLDYNLIKNFLESFKCQGGLSGPVSNLAGRLQPSWKLPRDGFGSQRFRFEPRFRTEPGHH